MTDPVSIALQLSAAALAFVSYWGIGNKRAGAHLLAVVSQATWAALNIYLGLYILLSVQGVSALIHLRNYRKWTANE